MLGCKRMVLPAQAGAMAPGAREAMGREARAGGQVARNPVAVMLGPLHAWPTP